MHPPKAPIVPGPFDCQTSVLEPFHSKAHTP